MKVFTVMTPPPSGDEARDAERVVFLKEGLSWPALLVAPVWLLVQRMWLVLLGYLVISVALAALGSVLGDGVAMVASLGFALLFALEANNLRRWTLERRGWTLAGIVTGNRRADYESRFFAGWRAAPAVRRRQRTDTPAGADDQVIGLFPEATR